MRATVAPYFQAQLKTLEELPLVGEVRGVGLMACVECVADRESKDPLELDKDVGKRIDAHCHELGLLVRPLINMCVMCAAAGHHPRADRRHGRHPARRHFAHHGRSAQGRRLAGLSRPPAAGSAAAGLGRVANYPMMPSVTAASTM